MRTKFECQKCTMKENGGMYGIKISYLMLYFFDKYRIDPTATS
jgi:hypothetical protein